MSNTQRFGIRLVMIVLALILSASTVSAQRGTTVGAQAASIDTCIAAVSYTLNSGSPLVVQGDTIVFWLHINTDTLHATRLEATISYANSALEYLDTDTAGITRPWGSEDWTITHDDVNDRVKVVAIFGTNPTVINHYLLKFRFAFGCADIDYSYSVSFVGDCDSTDNVVSHATLGNVAPGARTGAGFQSADKYGSASVLCRDDSTGPADTFVTRLDYFEFRLATGGMTVRLGFDETAITFAGLDQTGTASEGLSLSSNVVSYSGADTLVISTTDTVPGTLSVVPLLNVKWQNDMTDNFDTTSVGGRTEITDCQDSTLGSYIASADLITRYDATIVCSNQTTPKSTQDFVDFTILNNVPIDMDAPDSKRVRVRVNTGSLTGLSVQDNTTDGFYWEIVSAGGGDIYIREDPNSASNTIPVSKTPRQLFRLWYTAPGSCGTVAVDLKGGVDGSRTTTLNGTVMLDTTNGDLTLDDGQVNVTGCGGGPGPGPSCPYLTVWDGTGFAEENTILTQSEFTAEGVTVTDYYMLSSLPALQDGSYRLRIEERDDETSYLDEIRLLAVHADAGREVAVTPEGELFYTANSIRPTAAVDHNGEDVLAIVSEPDGDVYVCDGPGWLLVTYEPDTRGRVGSVYLGQGAVFKDPKLCTMKYAGDLSRVDDIRLRVSYRQDGGSWVAVPEGPPRKRNTGSFAATDLGITPGTKLEVKYEWSTRWETDDVTLNFSAGDKPRTTELKAADAMHSALGKVSSTLAEADNEFAVLNKGEAVELRFAAEQAVGMGATTHYIVAAKGYYVPFAQSNGLLVPDAFALHPNYPNPFNAQTNVSFALPSQADVSIVVFNVLGQTVKTLASGPYAAGEHTINWDGTNEQGLPVASGTYFIRMKSGEFEQQRKMTLLK